MPTAARAQGVSRATGYKWVRRFRAEGVAGLVDRSSRPHRSPRRTPPAEVERILPPGTSCAGGPIGWVRCSATRSRPSRPSCAGRGPRTSPTSTDRPACRCAATRPVTQARSSTRTTRSWGGSPTAAATGSSAGRPPHTPTARARLRPLRGDRRRSEPTIGRRPGPRRERRPARRSRSRRRWPSSLPTGSRVERVLTDNGWAYRSAAYRAVLGERRHSRTRPYRPQTNGKAERFIGTLVREWAYARPYRSNAERLAALPAFVDFYNHRRPHTALGGLSPSAVVNNVRGDHS